MNIILFVLTLSLTLSILLTALNFWLDQINPDSEKLSPYACGFDPLGSVAAAGPAGPAALPWRAETQR